jgi:hypothetical protein
MLSRDDDRFCTVIDQLTRSGDDWTISMAAGGRISPLPFWWRSPTCRSSRSWMGVFDDASYASTTFPLLPATRLLHTADQAGVDEVRRSSTTIACARRLANMRAHRADGQRRLADVPSSDGIASDDIALVAAVQRPASACLR